MTSNTSLIAPAGGASGCRRVGLRVGRLATRLEGRLLLCTLDGATSITSLNAPECRAGGCRCDGLRDGRLLLCTLDGTRALDATRLERFDGGGTPDISTSCL